MAVSWLQKVETVARIDCGVSVYLRQTFSKSRKQASTNIEAMTIA
ncbi:hypothetical protein PAMC26510_10450 [Caballeronia sordidicola]|uniref:Uncharacterized protein n=1 Tax=Caballeronia sordidicola TaxID=196367 RepID=A0A242MZI3_CABSO|nr:hypothetical protein PAMC26510_10450 [Caballeronia sordidicola]